MKKDKKCSNCSGKGKITIIHETRMPSGHLLDQRIGQAETCTWCNGSGIATR